MILDDSDYYLKPAFFFFFLSLLNTIANALDHRESLLYSAAFLPSMISALSGKKVLRHDNKHRKSCMEFLSKQIVYLKAESLPQLRWTLCLHMEME